MGLFDFASDLFGDGDLLSDAATVAGAIFGNNKNSKTTTTERQLDPSLKAFSDDVLSQARQIFQNMEYPGYPGERSAGPSEWLSYASDLGRQGAAASGARSWNIRNRAETGDQPYQMPDMSNMGSMSIGEIISAMTNNRQNTAVSGGPRSDDAYLTGTRGFGRVPWRTL